MESKKTPGDIPEIEQILGSIKTELADIRAELKTGLKAELESIRAELRTEIERMRTGGEAPAPGAPPSPGAHQPPRGPEPDVFGDRGPRPESFGRESKKKTEEYKLKDFSGIEVGGIFEVEIVRADSYSVSLTAEEELFRNLDVSSDHGTLRIGHSRHIGWKAQISRPKARITLPVLKELRLHGASKAAISGFDSAEPFRLSLSGASSASGDITAGNADFDLSGASRARLAGSARDVIINTSGAIHLELGDFSVHNVSVKMSGVCHGVIKMDGRLDARLSGVSHFSWIGNPMMGSIRTSGHSTLSKE